jgi:hypothetical protein
MAVFAVSPLDPTTDKPPRPQRWIPLSLKMFALILGTMTVWTGIRAYRQYVVIREIERVNGVVHWTRQRGPQWLRAALGQNLNRAVLDDILGVDFADSDASDSTLVYLKLLPHLEILSINRTSVTDAGLVHVAGLTSLKMLILGTNIGDAGLSQLNGLTRLESLCLSKTEVTDRGLPSIHTLSRLKRLQLDKTQVNGSGLQHLQGLPLWQLCAIGARIDDDGLAAVARLSGFTHLLLDETEITDAGIQKLAALPRLEYISIRGTAVTDSGIADLKGCDQTSWRG